MNVQSFIQKVSLRSILSVVLAIVVTTASGFGLFSAAPTAQAASLTTGSTILAEANPVDEVFGAGTTDKVQGKAKQDIGTVEKAVSDVKGQMQDAASQVKGTSKQVEGRAQQDVGRVKDAGSELEDASNEVGDAFKRLFGE